MARRVLALCLAFAATFALAQAPDGVPDPDTVFKGKTGGTFGKEMSEVLPNARRVAIPAFRVAFVVDNKVSAQVRAAYMPGGIDHSGARSSFQVTLQGVSPQTLQAITDRAYAHFVRELSAAGREVVPPEQMKEFFAAVGATPTSPAAPYSKEHNGQTLLFFAPTGMPLVFTHFDNPWGDRGFLDLTNYRKLEEYSGRWEAAVMAPTIVVNFARMSSSGNRSALTARVAETGGELAMSVAAFNSFWSRTTEFRNGMAMGGDQGHFSMSQPVVGAADFGTIQVAEQNNNAALKTSMDLLGKAMALGGGRGFLNLGGAATSSTKAVALTSDSAYSVVADDVLKRAAALLGSWFRKYPSPSAATTPAAAAAPAPAAVAN